MASLYEALKALADRFQIADFYVFGSRAKEITNRFRKETASDDGPQAAPIGHDSDVDIGIMPRREVRLTAKDRVGLTGELEDLLEANRGDLVILAEAEPVLALEVSRGELLYAENPDRQARDELYVLRRAGDLLPFKRQRLRLILGAEEG